MASLIDFSKPIYGSPTTQSVRDNFEIAQNEITDLQTFIETGPFVPLAGAEMTGKLTLSGDPVSNLDAATKQYVDYLAFGGGETGTPDAPKDGMFYARGGAIPAGENEWRANPLFTALRFGPDPATIRFGIRSDATYNFYDLANDGANLLRYDRSTKILSLLLNGNTIADFSDTAISLNRLVTLSADPTTALQAATKQYVDTRPAALIGDAAPTAQPGSLWWDSIGGQLYVRYNDGSSTQWVMTNSIQGQAATKQDVTTALNNVGRNLLHNSMFNIQQRGAGPFTLNVHTADRWIMGSNVSAHSISIYAVSDTQRSQIGDEAAQYILGSTFTGTAGASDYALVSQRIENVRRLAGKTITYSFWANASSPTLKVGIGGVQIFGTGGSPSATVEIAGQAITLDGGTTFKRYSTTLNIPSAQGKTMGTVGDNTQIDFWFSSGTTFTSRSGGVGVQSGSVNIWGVQLEIGNTLTPLEKPDIVMQQQQCQRFFINGGQLTIGGAVTLGVQHLVPMLFPVRMRTTPTFNYVGSGGSGYSSVGVFANGGVGFSAQIVPSVTGGMLVYYDWNASADL